MGRGELPTILDNMIADKRVPVMVAVMINSGGGDAQGSERGLEYDTLSGKYAEFIETEVLPRVTQDEVTFSTGTRRPRDDGRQLRRGLRLRHGPVHPERYHRVSPTRALSSNQQSPLNTRDPHGAWEYHEHLIPQSSRKPIRLWMHVSEQDLRFNDDEFTLHNWPMANIRMAAALKAKKYHYQFVFSKNARATWTGAW